MNPEITVSTAAASKIRQLVLEEGNPALKLRIYITGGGCSGFQYGFAFDEALEDGDLHGEFDGIEVIIDPMSHPYLSGSEVDYSEDLRGAQFVIRNPNAVTTCGCGASFAV